VKFIITALTFVVLLLTVITYIQHKVLDQQTDQIELLRKGVAFIYKATFYIAGSKEPELDKKVKEYIQMER
jgi:hypothetical protein